MEMRNINGLKRSGFDLRLGAEVCEVDIIGEHGKVSSKGTTPSHYNVKSVIYRPIVQRIFRVRDIPSPFGSGW